MFFRIVLKWLSISIIAVVCLLTVLLFLGYLLKENEITTTKLKVQLDLEAYQKQEKENRRKNMFSQIPTSLSPLEKSQQKTISSNLSCQTDKQCFLLHTHSKAIGCVVAVNTTGAAILLKVFSENENQRLLNNYCQQEYIKQRTLLAQCINNQCSF